MLGFGNRRQNQNFDGQQSYIAPNNTGSYQTAPQMPQQGEQQRPDPREEEYINMRIAQIDSEVQEFSRKNPNFDMKREMQNPVFCTYVWGNELSIEDAYYLTHKDDRTGGGRMNNPAERPAARIAENGTGRTAGSGMVKKNPKDLSDEELDDIVKRVREGERISF